MRRSSSDMFRIRANSACGVAPVDDCRLPAEADGPASVLLAADVLYAATLSADTCTCRSSAGPSSIRGSRWIRTRHTGWQALPEFNTCRRLSSLVASPPSETAGARADCMLADTSVCRLSIPRSRRPCDRDECCAPRSRGDGIAREVRLNFRSVRQPLPTRYCQRWRYAHAEMTTSVCTEWLHC